MKNAMSGKDSKIIVVLRKEIEIIDHTATGECARRYRLATGKSLRAVARELGISASFLSDLERGRRNWSVQLTLKYEDALKI